MKSKYTVLRRKLKYLESVLILASEKNWVNGIRAAISELQEENEQSYQKAISIYQSMNGGAGSFNDYYIHDDSPEIRVKKNLILDDLRNEIWEIITHSN